MQEERRVEPLVQLTARPAQPPQQFGVLRAVRIQGGRGLRHDVAATVGCDRGRNGGAEHLGGVVQRRLLADHHRAGHVASRRREVAEVGEEVALALAEPAAEQHRGAPVPTADGRPGSLEQLGEPVLDVTLPRAEGGDRVGVRHTAAEGLDRPAPGQPVAVPHVLATHGTASRRTSSRTIDAYGLGRRRSRTSSATRSCSAV